MRMQIKSDQDVPNILIDNRQTGKTTNTLNSIARKMNEFPTEFRFCLVLAPNHMLSKMISTDLNHKLEVLKDFRGRKRIKNSVLRCGEDTWGWRGMDFSDHIVYFDECDWKHVFHFLNTLCLPARMPIRNAYIVNSIEMPRYPVSWSYEQTLSQ